MNLLETYIEAHCLNPTHTLNILQEFGIVSDNAVTAADVSDKDCETAVEFLSLGQREVKP